MFIRLLFLINNITCFQVWVGDRSGQINVLTVVREKTARKMKELRVKKASVKSLITYESSGLNFIFKRGCYINM